MSCIICGEQEAYSLGKFGLCVEHLEKWIARIALKTIRDWKLLHDVKNLFVCVSGGKDSFVLAYIIEKYVRRLYSIKVHYICVDEGGKEERDVSQLESLLDINVETIRVENIVGFNLMDMVERALERKLELHPCTLCGVLRRYVINKICRERGADAVATGHNAEDELETFLLNMSMNNIKDFARMKPLVGVKRLPGFVPRIKPLMFIPEKAIATLAISLGYKPSKTVCPFVLSSRRQVVRHAIYKIERNDPLFARKIVKRLADVAARISHTVRKKYGRCAKCGEPTSRNICKLCELREQLGL